MADSLLSVKIRDDEGQTKNLPVFFTSSVTPANVQSFATAFLPLLDNVIGGVVESASLTLDITVPAGLKAAPLEDVTVRRGAVMSFDNPSRYNWSLYVPSWNLAYIQNGAILVADPDPAAFIAAYVTGAGGFTPSNGQGLDLTGLATAREAFRK
jgi:hypothetical protein